MSTDTKLTDLVVNTLTRKQYHEADLTGHGDELFVQSDHAGVFVGGSGVDALDTTNVTNCITEIPQDIKLELNAGTLTLKAGSKIYVPNGSGTFDAVTTTYDISAGSPYTDAPIFIFYYNGTLGQAAANAIQSGSSYTITNGFWYDTTNNYIKYISSGSVAYSGVGFPIGIVSATGGLWSNIDQVFNGFGCVGSTVFALPRVKGLIPNGRNADGTLKNTVITKTNVSIGTYSGGDAYLYFGVSSSTGSVYFQSFALVNYDEKTNTTTWPVAIFGSFYAVSTKITQYQPKSAFHAVDYSEADFVVASQLPTSSNNYTWYRKYKSGWVEQGGSYNSAFAGTKTFNLPIAMADTNYTLTTGTGCSDVGGMHGKDYITSKTTTSFDFTTVSISGNFAVSLFSWRVEGIAA